MCHMWSKHRSPHESHEIIHYVHNAVALQIDVLMKKGGKLIFNMLIHQPSLSSEGSKA